MSKYPLQQLMEIKLRRLEEAERELTKRKEELEEEEKKLEAAKKALQEVLDHKAEKMEQMRAEMDKGTTTDKIEQMKKYLDTVEDKRKVKDDAMKKQQLEVEKAETAVEEARQNVFRKQADVEKLKMHRKEWDAEQLYLEKQEDAKQTEETGTAMHVRKKKKKG